MRTAQEMLGYNIKNAMAPLTFEDVMYGNNILSDIENKIFEAAYQDDKRILWDNDSHAWEEKRITKYIRLELERLGYVLNSADESRETGILRIEW